MFTISITRAEGTEINPDIEPGYLATWIETLMADTSVLAFYVVREEKHS